MQLRATVTGVMQFLLGYQWTLAGGKLDMKTERNRSPIHSEETLLSQSIAGPTTSPISCTRAQIHKHKLRANKNTLLSTLRLYV